MSVFSSYAVLMFIVTNVYAFLLRCFSLYFVYDTLQQDIGSSSLFVITLLTNIVLLLVLAIAYKILKPFDRVITRIKNGG